MISGPPKVSVVIPVHNEGENVIPVVERILRAVDHPCEIMGVYDDPSDPTVPVLERLADLDDRVKPVNNTYGRGPAHALRYGLDHATGDVAVVTMADGSDDPRQIDALVRLVERGVAVAAASRYMASGQQVDAPLLKAALSRLGGFVLWLFARVGTKDPTNSFKAYDLEFVRQVGVHSEHGFELGIEMVAKARRLRRPVAEIPTIWLERQVGESSFKILSWLPAYLGWFRFAFGPRLTVEQVRARADELTRNLREQSSRNGRGGLHRGLRREGTSGSGTRGRRSG